MRSCVSSRRHLNFWHLLDTLFFFFASSSRTHWGLNLLWAPQTECQMILCGYNKFPLWSQWTLDEENLEFMYRSVQLTQNLLCFVLGQEDLGLIQIFYSWYDVLVETRVTSVHSMPTHPKFRAFPLSWISSKKIMSKLLKSSRDLAKSDSSTPNPIFYVYS